MKPRFLIPHDTLNDVNLRWQQCYMHLNGELILLAHVRDVIDDDTILADYYPLVGGVWEESLREQIKVSELDYSLPTFGMVDVCNFAVHVGQAARGSYRLGLGENRLHIHVIGEDVSRAMGKKPSFFPNAVVPRMYNPKYDPFDVCVEAIMSKKVISKSLNKKYAIAACTKTKLLGLYRGRHLIGELNPSTYEVVLPYKHRYFMEEINEYGFEVQLSRSQ